LKPIIQRTGSVSLENQVIFSHVEDLSAGQKPLTASAAA